MITNINLETHTADFKCDLHGGIISGLNLNTTAEYIEADTTIKITLPCSCNIFIPVLNGNEDAQAIAAAKTE